MDPGQAKSALSTLAAAVAARPDLAGLLEAGWKPGAPTASGEGGDVPPSVREAADALDRSLPAVTQSSEQVAALGTIFGEPARQVLLSWCRANAGRTDVRMAPLLAIAAAHPTLRERTAEVACERVTQGPLVDALACAPQLGPGSQLALPGNIQARARLEILI